MGGVCVETDEVRTSRVESFWEEGDGPMKPEESVSCNKKGRGRRPALVWRSIVRTRSEIATVARLIGRVLWAGGKHIVDLVISPSGFLALRRQ